MRPFSYNEHRSHCCCRETYPLIKMGQTITVCLKNKKFGVKVTQPNAINSNVVVGMANGKTYTCWYNGGTWSTNNR